LQQIVSREIRSGQPETLLLWNGAPRSICPELRAVAAFVAAGHDNANLLPVNLSRC
jgi:hypothetical protein